MTHAEGQPGVGQPTQGKKSMQIKVYLVFLRLSLARPGQPNVKVIAAKLTQVAAQQIVDRTPGSYIEKHVAVK